MDADGENARALTEQQRSRRSRLELSPDNSQVLFLADTNERFEPYYPTNLFVVPAAGGTPRPLLPDFRYTFEQAAWAPDGQSILAVVNMGVHSEIFQIDVASRRARQLTDGGHFIPSRLGGGAERRARCVFQLDEPTRFGDVWTLPIAGERRADARHAACSIALERDFALPRQEKVEWKSADGATIEGVLFYPVGLSGRAQRYPLVVQLHGGPWSPTSSAPARAGR